MIYIYAGESPDTAYRQVGELTQCARGAAQRASEE